jgi:hypothetical protein
VKLGTTLGVSEHEVCQALKVQKADPELLKQVQRGTTQRAFEVEIALGKVMQVVDRVLAGGPATCRRSFIARLIKTLQETVQ